MHYQDLVSQLEAELEEERGKLPTEVYFQCSKCETELGFSVSEPDAYGRSVVSIEPCPSCTVIPKLEEKGE